MVADPKVSTDESLRISACRLIISRIPNARLMVTIAGNPSGTAAIARLTDTMNISSKSPPRMTPIPNTNPQTIKAAQPNVLPN